MLGERGGGERRGRVRDLGEGERGREGGRKGIQCEFAGEMERVGRGEWGVIEGGS